MTISNADAERISSSLQPIQDDLGKAKEAAAEEAAAANVTPQAVLKSSPEGYATGDGATWPNEATP